MNTALTLFLALSIAISSPLGLISTKATTTKVDNKATVISAPADWAKEYIDEVLNLKMIDMRLSKNYQAKITRADFAYLGVRMYEILSGKEASKGEASFSDTTDEYVLKAKNHGIVNGYPDGTYLPNNPITREELAVLFANTLNMSGKSLMLTKDELFPDDDKIGDWAKTRVYTCKRYGIVKGMDENKFEPKYNATNEQAIVMFKRTVDRFSKDDYNKDLIELPSSQEKPSNPTTTETPAKPQTPQAPTTSQTPTQPENPPKLPDISIIKSASLINTQAVDFTLKGMSGKDVSYNKAQNRVTLIHVISGVNFVSMDGLISFSELEKKYPNVKFILIDTLDKNFAESAKTIKGLGIKADVINDELGTILSIYSVSRFPYSLIIRADGVIDNMVEGNISQKILLEYLNKALY